MLRPLQIGNVVIDPPVVLAPMEGVTDRPFRTLVRSLGGCGLAVTEFISSEALTREVDDAWRMAELDPSEHPVSIQIYGRDPERMAQAARQCQALGADLIDINLGCPSKRVTSGCAGSALLREPGQIREILEAVHEAITVPLTVKMRLGWDHDHYQAPEVAAMAVDIGAKMIAVHGRTKSDGYKNDARWDLVRRVREAVAVPLLVNGDIVDTQTARAALEASGADGVMVGRAVMSDPWSLARIAAGLSETPFHEPSLLDRRDALLAFVDRSAAVPMQPRQVSRAVARLRNVIGYFSRGLYGAARLRASLHEVHDLVAARVVVEAFFAAALAHQEEREVGA